MRGGSAKGLFIKRMKIKFRAKADPQWEWVYGHYCFASEALGCPHNIPCIQQFDKDESRTLSFRSIHPVTVGQFTGLRDKNGKEIYEGDIIESQGYSNARHYVKYIDDKAMFVAIIISPNSSLMDFCSISQSWIDKYDKKIIGNIFDNPELL